jgi:hypothetical protein
MSLAEIASRFIQQSEPGLHKRWFSDEELDLTVWQEEDSGQISHFQLIYRGRELVEWDSVRGVRSGRVHGDADEHLASASRTYVLSSAVDPALLQTVRTEFARSSDLVVLNVREFVLCALEGNSERLGSIRFESPLAAPALPLVPESRALSIAFKTPYGILRSMQEQAGEGFRLMTLGRSFCLFQRMPGGTAIDPHYTVRNITLKLPHQILGLLQEAGSAGMILAGVGGSYLFLAQAEPPGSRQFRMDSITLRTARGVRRLVERTGQEGWALCGLGFNFAFFERMEGPATVWEHKAVWCRQFDLPERVAARLLALLARESVEGWRPCALGSRQLFFRRPAPP